MCRYDEFAELSAPITEVIYTDDVVSQMLENAVKRAADNGCGKVSDMERFCNVYGTIIYANRLARALVACTDVLVFCNRKCHFRNGVSIKKHVEISSYNLDFLYEIERLYVGQKFVCNHRRSKPHRASKLEARQTYVAERGVFGCFESVFDVLFGKSFHGKRLC